MASSRGLLRGISIFGGLSEEALDYLAERVEPVSVAAGDFFFREGDLASSVWVIEAGSAEVVKARGDQTFVFVTFHAGSCFGETALMGIAPQTAGIRAATDCRAVRLGKGVLHALSKRDLEQFTIIQMNLGREIARRFVMLGEILFEHSLAKNDEHLVGLGRAIHDTMK